MRVLRDTCVAAQAVVVLRTAGHDVVWAGDWPRPSLGAALCWAEGTTDCKPSSLNIPGAPYPCVHADRRVTFRVQAPDAQKVQVRLGGPHDMTKGADGLWMVTIPPQVVGFHYYTLVIDGATVAKCLMIRQVESEIGDLQSECRFLRVTPTQRGDPGHQFLHGERFWQVIIRAEL